MRGRGYQFGGKSYMIAVCGGGHFQTYIDTERATAPGDESQRLGNDLVRASAKAAARNHRRADAAPLEETDRSTAVLRPVGVLAVTL
eukprot:5089312-Pyramimonas_sp.AAC.1